MSDKMRLLAMIQMARRNLQLGNLGLTDQILQDLLTGDLKPEHMLTKELNQVQFDRAFKQILISTNTKAIYLRAEPTEIIGHMAICAGGDRMLLDQLNPILQQAVVKN